MSETRRPAGNASASYVTAPGSLHATMSSLTSNSSSSLALRYAPPRAPCSRRPLLPLPMVGARLVRLPRLLRVPPSPARSSLLLLAPLSSRRCRELLRLLGPLV